MPTLVACLWRCVEATQLGRVPTHFGPATRPRRPESQRNQGALATSQVEMCPRTANSGLARFRCRTCVVSKAVRMVEASIALFVRFGDSAGIGELLSMLA